MATNRRIEIFSADCPLREEVIDMVKSISCPSCEVTVLDMNKEFVSQKAE